MNEYITIQIQQMQLYAKAWEASCDLAAKKGNGTIDAEEAKALKRIHRAVERFNRDLGKI